MKNSRPGENRKWHTGDAKCLKENLKGVSARERGLIKEIEELRNEVASLSKNEQRIWLEYRELKQENWSLGIKNTELRQALADTLLGL